MHTLALLYIPPTLTMNLKRRLNGESIKKALYRVHLKQVVRVGIAKQKQPLLWFYTDTLLSSCFRGKSLESF